MPFLKQSESVIILIPQRPKQIIKLKLEISNFQFLTHLLHFIFHLHLQEEKEAKQYLALEGQLRSLAVMISSLEAPCGPQECPGQQSLIRASIEQHIPEGQELRDSQQQQQGVQLRIQAPGVQPVQKITLRPT